MSLEKKSLRALSLVTAILLVIGCKKNESVFEKDLPWIQVSRSTIDAPAEASSQYIILSSNTDCRLGPSPEWLTYSTERIEGNTILGLVFSENTTLFPRNCTLNIYYGDKETSLHIRQQAYYSLSVTSEKEVLLTCDAGTLPVTLRTNCPINISTDAPWIAMDGYDITEGNNKMAMGIVADAFTFQVFANLNNNERKAYIAFSNDTYGVSDTVIVHQAAFKSDYYADGDWIHVQQSLRSNGPHLIVMGDGFTKEDLLISDCQYSAAMHEAIDYFFNIEPYITYKEYFSVDIVFAESAQKGVGDEVHHQVVDNKFGSKYGEGTEVDANVELCLEYAKKVGYPEEHPLTVMVILNDNKYAGTTYLYMDGNSVAFCPMSSESSPNNFEGVVHHETGGHGFGFLADEYVYHDTSMPEETIQQYKAWHERDFQTNLDFTGKERTCAWASFIGLKGYSQVGLYEGGGLYKYGVWRSEPNSCMNNNVPYYNVQSRRSIVERIMSLSGLPFVIEDFIAKDLQKAGNSYSRFNVAGEGKEFRPLATPIWK